MLDSHLRLKLTLDYRAEGQRRIEKLVTLSALDQALSEAHPISFGLHEIITSLQCLTHLRWVSYHLEYEELSMIALIN